MALTDLMTRAAFRTELNTAIYQSGKTLEANRTIALSTFTYTLTANGLGVTSAEGRGIWITNTTAAAAGAQQISPSITWEGQGWKTNATAASQSVKFMADVLPVQGAANPTATWRLRSSINGAAYISPFTVSSDVNTGAVFSANFFTLSAANPALLIGSTNGSIRFPGSGTGTISYNVTSVLPGATGFLSLRNFSPNITATSGTASEIGIGSGFAPASGTTVYNMVTSTQTINSDASGAVTFFNMAPTITAAPSLTGFDWNPSADPSGAHYAFRARRGDITIEDSLRGTIYKDDQGIPHYWRANINSSGAWVITDLGTSI